MGKRIADIEGISEETANGLINSLKSFAESTPFHKADCKPVIRHFIVRAYYDLYYKKVSLYFKLINATFITRWYYSKKYFKAYHNLIKAEKALKDFDHE